MTNNNPGLGQHIPSPPAGGTTNTPKTQYEPNQYIRTGARRSELLGTNTPTSPHKHKHTKKGTRDPPVFTFFLPNCCTRASLSATTTAGSAFSSSTGTAGAGAGAGAGAAAAAVPSSPPSPDPPSPLGAATHLGSVPFDSSAEAAVAAVGAGGAGAEAPVPAAAAAVAAGGGGGDDFSSSSPVLPSAALMAAAAAPPPPWRLTHRFASGSGALCFGFTGLRDV